MIIQECVPEVVIRMVGDVSNVERAYAEEQFGRIGAFVGDPGNQVVTVELRREDGEVWTRPFLVKASVTLSGRALRAYGDAMTMFEAIDAVAARLRRRIDAFDD